MNTIKRARVDQLVFQRGLVESLELAARVILAGEVWAGDRRIDKPGTLLPVTTVLELRGTAGAFVSRGGLKLDAALEHWQIDVCGLVGADIGASTGGFTDCLLQRGARRVIAVDVGYGQFAWKLRQDPRVVLFERTNVRNFDTNLLPEAADIAVVDVSFISLRSVLSAVLHFLKPGALLLPLVKPQFEVDKSEVGEGGVVREEATRLQAVARVRTVGETMGLSCSGEFLCPLPGPKGNREYFLHFTLPG